MCNMAKRIVFTGRGVTGKTTFIALATKYLSSPIHPMGYQNCLLLSTITPYPRINPIQEEVDYIFLREVSFTPIIERFLQCLVGSGDTGAGNVHSCPIRA